MLKSTYRLPARTRFASPSLLSSPLFTIKIGENRLPYSRFGFIISKKTAKTAVARNRSKRLLRSYIEDVRERIVAGKDFLFILKKNLVYEKTVFVREEVLTLLKKAQLIEEKT